MRHQGGKTAHLCTWLNLLERKLSMFQCNVAGRGGEETEVRN